MLKGVKDLTSFSNNAEMDKQTPDGCTVITHHSKYFVMWKDRCCPSKCAPQAETVPHLVEFLSGMPEAQGLISNTRRKKNRKCDS